MTAWKIGKRFVQLNMLTTGASLGFALYVYPEILNDPMMFAIGYRRSLRECYAGLRVGLDYYFNWEKVNAEIHYRNARILYDMCAKNGGPFIKIGQSVAQMDSLVPDPYIEVFEPMC